MPTHQEAQARALLEATGAQVCFLPPYSPDLNPIEKLWSKTKQSLRQLQERTVPKLLRLVTRVVKQVTPSDC